MSSGPEGLPYSRSSFALSISSIDLNQAIFNSFLSAHLLHPLSGFVPAPGELLF